MDNRWEIDAVKKAVFLIMDSLEHIQSLHISEDAYLDANMDKLYEIKSRLESELKGL